jgi:hypothetical protein
MHSENDAPGYFLVPQGLQRVTPRETHIKERKQAGLCDVREKFIFLRV